MIYAHPLDQAHPRYGSSTSVCFKRGDKIVSLTLDDGRGGPNLSRGTIELFRQPDPADEASELCTHEVWPERGSVVVEASMQNFERALRWLDRASWGLDAQTPSRGNGLLVYK